MSALMITLLRFGFLALLWIFVFIVVATVRRDVFGTRVRSRTTPASSRTTRKQHTPQATASTSRQHVQSAAPELRLVVTQGPLAGTRLSMGSAPILVGRSPDSALVLDDNYASSRHARFYREGDRVIIEDLDSTNGTWVGDTQIHEPTILPVGMPVIIGKTVMEVQQ